MNKSVIFRINFLMITIVSLFFLIFGTLDYYLDTKSNMADLHSDLTRTINRLVKTLSIPIWDLDTFKMVDSINAEMQNQNIKSITVYDSNTDKILIGKTRDQQWNIVDEFQNEENPDLTKTLDVIHQKEKIALLKIEVTDKYIKEEILLSAISQVRRIVLFMLILIIILTVTIYIVVLKPIKKLTKTVRKISEGNISEPVSDFRDDEIGYLAKNFAIMQNTIKMKIDSLSNEINERAKIEKKIQNLQNYLTNIIDSMPSILIGVDSEGKISQWNKTTEQLTGISADKALEKYLPDVFPRMKPYIESIFVSLKTFEIKQEKKKLHITETGTHYEDITIYPLVSNGVQGAVIRIDDMTEQVLMEEMMIQSEKMLSIGGLAAGMAHEINNPLAGMIQTANVMANRLGDKIDLPISLKAAEEAGTTIESVKNFIEFREIPRMLKTIIVSGHRISEIVNNMLSFARKSEGQISSHSLTEIIEKSLKLAANDYDLKKEYDFKMIEILKDYEKNLPLVPCEETKIQQVLLNLFRNSSEALQDAEIENPKLIIKTYYLKKGEFVCVEIGDNGPGMDEETRSRVFEPFFTKKPIGEGTGLGLSVSYFIITENLKGEMSVKSTYGEGSTFIIRLPIGNNSQKI